MFPRIIIRTPAPQGRTLLWLDVSPVIIGSSKDCDVVIALGGIAPKHFELEVLSNNRVKINRLDGKVLIDGKSVISGFLKEGMVLQLSPLVFLEFYDAYVRVNPPASYAIKFVTKPLLNKVFDIKSNKTIGRTRGDIIIQDKTVSRQHANIEISKGHLYIKDNNSVNGIVLNGQKIAKNSTQELFDHDLVDVGDVAFIVKGEKINLPENEFVQAVSVTPLGLKPNDLKKESASALEMADDPRKIQKPNKPQKAVTPVREKELGPDDTLFADDLIMAYDDFSDEELLQIDTNARLGKIDQDSLKQVKKVDETDISKENTESEGISVSISERMKLKRKGQYSDKVVESEIDSKLNLDIPSEVEKLNANSKVDDSKSKAGSKPEIDDLELEIDKLIDDLTNLD